MYLFRRKLTSAEKIKILPGEGIKTFHFSPEENKTGSKKQGLPIFDEHPLTQIQRGLEYMWKQRGYLKNKYRDVRVLN